MSLVDKLLPVGYLFFMAGCLFGISTMAIAGGGFVIACILHILIVEEDL
jgi:hypothetical protein